MLCSHGALRPADDGSPRRRAALCINGGPWLDFLAAATGLSNRPTHRTTVRRVVGVVSSRFVEVYVDRARLLVHSVPAHPGTLRTNKKDALAVPSILTRSQREVCVRVSQENTSVQRQ